MNIDIKNLTVTFPSGTKLFNNASFSFKGPGLYFLLGANGAGKSTLAKLLAGIAVGAREIEGELFIDGKAQQSFMQMEQRDIAYIHQDSDIMLAPHFTTRQNIALAQLPHYPDLRIFEETNESLLNIPMDIPVNDLSGGQRQLLTITMALIGKPALLICDEPTSALDSKHANMIMDMLENISKDTLCICISHDMTLIKRYENAYLIQM